MCKIQTKINAFICVLEINHNFNIYLIYRAPISHRGGKFHVTARNGTRTSRVQDECLNQCSMGAGISKDEN